MEEPILRTLEIKDITPARAYAALRAKAPGRTSYLVEMNERDERGEQRSIIGFLAKRESAHPPAVDALRDLARTAAALPAAPAQPEAASGCSADALFLLLFDAILPAYAVEPRVTQGFVGREIREAESIAFDHVAGTITIVSSHPNIAERIARAVADAPPLPPLAPATGAPLEHCSEQPPSPDFTKQLTRAGRRMTMGGLTRLLLARHFTAPRRGADTFEVYRALQEASAMRHSFFVDLAASPMFPAYCVAGAGRAIVQLSASTDLETLAKELHALVPIGAVCGAPAKDALKAWREISSLPLDWKGGSIARARAGGTIDLYAVDTFVKLEDEQLCTIGVAEVVPDRDADAHTAAAAEDAALALSAIQRAHDTARIRDEASAPQA